jgi:hypothetical protein
MPFLNHHYRYIVKLDDGRLLRLKPQNLVEAQPSADGGASSPKNASAAPAAAPSPRPSASQFLQGPRPTYLTGNSNNSNSNKSRSSSGRSSSALGLRPASANNVASSTSSDRLQSNNNSPSATSGTTAPLSSGNTHGDQDGMVTSPRPIVSVGSRLAAFEKKAAAAQQQGIDDARARQAPRRVSDATCAVASDGCTNSMSRFLPCSLRSSCL